MRDIYIYIYARPIWFSLWSLDKMKLFPGAQLLAAMLVVLCKRISLSKGKVVIEVIF